MFAIQVSEVLKNPDALQNAAHPIIYHQFLREREDGYIPPSEMVLRDEAMLFITAGVDTVSDALTVGTLNVLYNPAIHKRLQQELLEAWPIIDQPPRYEDLERISYLVRQQLALLYFACSDIIHLESRYQRIFAYEPWCRPSHVSNRAFLWCDDLWTIYSGGSEWIGQF